MKKDQRKRSMQSITVMLFVITLLIWVVLLFLKIILWGISAEELIEDIISNILGILPPMLIFNFIYEYLTKDHIADEISEQITKTLLGNSDSIEGFNTKDKIRFVKNTIGSLVGQDSAEMVNAVVEPYITNQYNIRTFFKYTIILRDYSESELFSSDEYMKIYENFKYKKKYIGEGSLPEQLHIAFIYKNHELDLALRNRKYIFQENLSVAEKELNALIALSDEEKLRFVKNEMCISMYIDERVAEIKNVTIDESGIDIEYESHHDKGIDSHSIEINFAMPQLKGYGEFLVSITEPTYSPIIQLSYPESTMNVTAFSFLNDGDESSVEQATHNIGNYEFCIRDRWIYPMSGVVFMISDKDNKTDGQ